ncbi:hypothetical protein [Streptomyces sp. MCA2]|uniref:hypothetical protein n=1 Tax=Streptomyces sp. MCA2 TaxID=2944805 RepID=UPI0035AB8287
MWNPEVPGASAQKLGRHALRVRAVTVTADGKVVSGGDDGKVMLWNPAHPAAPGRDLASVR